MYVKIAVSRRLTFVSEPKCCKSLALVQSESCTSFLLFVEIKTGFILRAFITSVITLLIKITTHVQIFLDLQLASIDSLLDDFLLEN